MKKFTVLLIGIGLFASFSCFAKINRYYERFCRSSAYYCVIIKDGQSWRSMFPNPRMRDLVQRLNRMNIPLRRGMRIAVPKYPSRVNHWNISPLSPYIQPTGSKVVVVNLSHLAWGAYDANGKIVHWGPISGGADYCSDIGAPCKTVTGKFKFFHTRGPNCKSSIYPVGKGGDPMPYCMFFKGGFAMHGSPAVPGYNASHGCVRMFTADARWLHDNFVDMPYSGRKATEIIVTR